MKIINYDEYINNKEKHLLRAFSNITNKKISIFKNTNPTNYRHISTLSAVNLKGRLRLGQFIPKTKTIKPVRNDQLVDKDINSLFILIEDILNKYKIIASDNLNKRGILKHVIIRKSHYNNDLLVSFITKSTLFPNNKNIINEIIKERKDVKTVIQIIQVENTKYANVGTPKVLYGKGYIIDMIDDLKFEISSQSFYQVNPYVSKSLYLESIKQANLNKETDIVYEGFSGVGTLTLLISKYAKSVYGIEINKEAHLNAVNNKRNNKILNANFILGDANKVLLESNINPTLVFVDPTVQGLSKEFVNVLIKNKPQKIVYISCNYITQIRDLKMLSKYYNIEYIKAFDMFSYTDEIEMLVVLIRK